MSKTWVIVISLLSVSFLVLAIFFLIGYFKPKVGGILVNTSPASSVYINGSLVGKTPYEGTFDPGVMVVKLVPEASDKNYLPYESKVAVISGMKTVVRREFAETNEGSSGDVVSFEKEGGGETSLVVITTPDNAQVSVDGTPKGFAPYKFLNVTPGDHQLTIRAVGYADRILTVNVKSGYRLSVVSALAKTDIPKEEVAGESTEKKTFVEILTTPTGFLRVRTEPGANGREIDQVTTGSKYLLLEEDTETGWFKIQLEAPAAGLPEGREGWVSNEYSQKIEEEVLPDSPPETP